MDFFVVSLARAKIAQPVSDLGPVTGLAAINHWPWAESPQPRTDRRLRPSGGNPASCRDEWRVDRDRGRRNDRDRGRRVGDRSRRVDRDRGRRVGGRGQRVGGRGLPGNSRRLGDGRLLRHGRLLDQG